jgi:hypothetical protein
MDLWADTDVSKENAASIIRDQVCRFINMLVYIEKLGGG